MKKILTGLMCLASITSFAATGFTNASPEINEKGVCKNHAIANLISFAMENNAKFDVRNFRLVENDRRALNPIHYSWYEVDLDYPWQNYTVRTLVSQNRITRKCNY